MPVKIPRKPKRTPGERAGLTRAKIVSHAIRVFEANPTEVSVAAIARSLHVAPRAVYFHFKGGMSEIVTAMAAKAIADVARPLQPNEDWTHYIRDLFASSWRHLKPYSALPAQATAAVAGNPFLNPHLMERVLFALALAGVENANKAEGLELVLGSLIGFIAIEFPMALTPNAEGRAQAVAAAIGRLSATEFPQIYDVQTELAARAAVREASNGDDAAIARSRRFADAVIGGLIDLASISKQS